MRFMPARLRRVGRRLLRAPLFSAVAILTLAVGIGANAAIFSVVNGVLLKPLPFDEPDRLVGVWHTAPGINIPLLNQGPTNYFVYREESRTFTDFALWDGTSVSITGTGEPERVQALMVTDGLLGLLGVDPAAGRAFAREDDQPGAPDRVMLTHAFWQRRFGGDAAVGRMLMVDGKPREIIGVLPERFRFLDRKPQLLMPFRFNRGEIHVGNFSYQGIARLKPGATIEQANADVARMLPMTIERFPLPPGFSRQMFDAARIGPRVRPLAEDVIGDVGQMLWILLGTVGLVLLIACANVANLFLVRAEGRQQELAIHAALGAGWRRITWELLSESLTLAVLGGLLGLGLAYGGIRALAAIAPAGLPRVEEIAIDAAVLLFTAAISLAAGLLFGLIPVLRFARPRLANALKEGGRLSSAGRARHRARNTLVVIEIALAVVLLVASGLMVRTFQAMQRVDPGFTEPADVLTLRVAVPESLAAGDVDAVRMHEQIAQAIARVPGVRSVGVTSDITMDGNDSNDPIFVEDFPVPEGQIPPIRRYKWIGEGYFETMGNPIVAGRALEWRDSYTLAPVVVISENLAREFWKDPALAVGRRVRNTPSAPWRTMVGVAGDERDDGVTRPAPTVVYWPVVVEKLWSETTTVQRSMAYVIRNERFGSPTLLREVQQAVWSVNPNLPVANVQTLAEIQAQSMAQTSFALVMVSIAAGVALLLGIVGHLRRDLLRRHPADARDRHPHGARRRAAPRQRASSCGTGCCSRRDGIAAGAAGAAGVTRLMSSMLFGVGPLDPVTYAAVALGLGATALLASYLPAARAARIDPSVALRFDV